VPLRHEPRHSALSDVEAELQKLAVDPWSAPERVGGGHSGNQSLDLGPDGRTTYGRPSREVSSVLAEASALPSQDGVGRHNDESLPPASPDFGQRDPQEAVGRPELRSADGSLIDGKLLAQGEVLKGELAMAAEQEREKPEHVK
jgi:hypothetical protein